MSGDKAAEAQAMIKAIVDNGETKINSRKYCYLKMTHKQRRKVLAFYSKVRRRIQAQNISFVGTPEFENVEAVILAAVTIDGSLLSKLGDAHWEAYPSDYMTFITTSFSVISFCYLSENIDATLSKAEALAMIKSNFDNGEAEINGRKYCYLKMTHKQRLKVCSFYNDVGHLIQAQDISFIDTPEFEAVEDVILSAVTIDGSLLSKLGDAHWESHPSDYVTFITTSLAVISSPFFPELPTASA